MSVRKVLLDGKPIPDDWDGQSYTQFAGTCPDSPKWRAMVRGGILDQANNWDGSEEASAAADGQIFETVDSLEFGDVMLDDYYTKAEVDGLLDAKAEASHLHDGRYYTEQEINNLLGQKSDSGHSHDSLYYREWEVNNLLQNKADKSDIIGMYRSRLWRSSGQQANKNSHTVVHWTNASQQGGSWWNGSTQVIANETGLFTGFLVLRLNNLQPGRYCQARAWRSGSTIILRSFTNSNSYWTPGYASLAFVEWVNQGETIYFSIYHNCDSHQTIDPNWTRAGITMVT